MLLSPVRDGDQWHPDRFLIQQRSHDIGARDNQRIEAALRQILELEIVLFDMLLGLCAAIQLRYGEWIDIEPGT